MCAAPGGIVRRLVLLILLLSLTTFIQATTKPEAARNYGQLPLSFEANRGQAPGAIDFVAHGQGFTLSFSKGEALFSFPGESGSLHLSISGAAAVPAKPGELLPGQVNYFRGTDERQWLRNIPTYRSITYSNLLPGIDLRYYGNQRRLEYDFVIAPGADPKTIRLELDGSRQLLVANDGSIIVHGDGRDLKWQPPVSYQIINGSRREIRSHYILTGANQFSFKVGAYDTTKPLIIDPVLGYSTYLGGHGQDTVADIALDNEGHAFVTGSAGSVSFPTSPGSYRPTSPSGYEGFVSKLSIDGSRLLYSTFLDSTEPQGIAVDSSGNAYIAGSVQAGRTIPTRNAYHASPYGKLDAFLLKLNASGSDLIYSTYFGGNQDDSAASVAVYNGTPYVYGWTTSGNLPLQSASQTQLAGSLDAFLARFSADGRSLIFSTYLGGTDTELPADLAVDTNGNAYVTGQTASLDFPTTNHIGAVDDLMAFVTKYSSSANLEYSTTVNGTAGADLNGFTPTGIAVDSNGNTYLTGNGGPGFPTTSGAVNTTSQCGGNCELRAVKLNAAGDALIYSAAFGGDTDDQANDIAIDSFGNAFVTGYTYSKNLPLANALQSQLNKGAPGGCGGPEAPNADCSDAFVTELNSSGSALLFSSYLGGAHIDIGVALKWWSGRLFVTGNTQSTNFPVTANAFQKTFSGSTDPWITRIDLGSTGGGGTGCTPQADPGVKICSPTNGSTVSAGKVHIQAVTTSVAPVVGTKVYVDGQTKYSFSKASVDFYTTLTVKGQRRLTVNSWTSSGVILSRTIYFTIQ